MSAFLPREFFQRDPVTCARELIGCRLVWGEASGIIVETEAYAALGDEACHTWSRPSARAFVAEKKSGAAYVYFNYGMYWMLNVLIKGGQSDGFVLFRALEPLAGVSEMSKRREAARRQPGPPLPLTALCSGPGKLAQALGVTGKDHGRDFCSKREIGFLPSSKGPTVIAAPRIGISRAKELPWRFLLRDNKHVSAPAPFNG